MLAIASCTPAVVAPPSTTEPAATASSAATTPGPAASRARASCPAPGSAGSPSAAASATPEPTPIRTPRATLRVVATATLPGNSNSTNIAVDANRNRVYVLSLDGLLSTLDTSTNAVLSSVRVGELADGLAVDPLTGRLYVYFSRSQGTFSGGSLSVIDGPSNTVITTIDATSKDPFGTGGIAVNPTTGCVYVGDFMSKVAVVDAATNLVLGSVPVDGQPVAIAVDTTNRVFVATAGPTNRVVVIDGRTNAVVDRFVVPDTPRAIAVSPVTGRIYVTTGVGTIDARLTVHDGATFRIVKILTVMNRPNQIVVDPVANRIYVANVGSDTVSVIDGTTDEIVSTATVAHAMGEGIGVDPRTGRIYVEEHIQQPRTLQVLE